MTSIHKSSHIPSNIPSNKAASTLYHACQLGKHVQLPVSRSKSSTSALFQLIHCDLWTSPILSTFGFPYYLVVLDYFSQFMWIFLLHRKSDTTSTLLAFLSYACMQFDWPIRSIQADNGTEFVNSAMTNALQ